MSLLPKEPKKQDSKFFGLENASPTFQKIITKYRQKRKDLNEKPKSILAFVEKARYLAENRETEDEYMMKELKHDRKFTQNIVYLYGQRAENHYNEINNQKEYKPKVNKNYFFTPKEIQRLKTEKNKPKIKTNSLPLLTDFIFKKGKSVFSPDTLMKTNSTFGKGKKSINSSKNSTGMLGFFNTTSNIRNIKTEENKKKTGIKKISISKFLNTDCSKYKERKNNLFYYNTKTEVFRDQIEDIDNNRKRKRKNKTNSEFNFNRIIYMDRLMQYKDYFTKTKNEFKKHFTSNDYGCNHSKLEYEYLKKKYFNNF
jgi:hypothetical protein